MFLVGKRGAVDTYAFGGSDCHNEEQEVGNFTLCVSVKLPITIYGTMGSSLQGFETLKR